MPFKTEVDDGISASTPAINPDAKASFKGFFVNGFFIGREHPIDYSHKFIKRLKTEYWQHGVVNDVEIDLTTGSNTMDEKPTTMSFGVILDYLMDQKRRSGRSPLHEIIYGADIVCRRGALNKLFQLPHNSDFLFGVKKFQGVYFISELPSPKLDEKNARMAGDKYRVFLPKFKKYIIKPYGDDKHFKKYSGEDINTWDQYQGVFVADFEPEETTGSNALRVFYGSELDALDIESSVVEIKLQSRGLTFARHDSMVEKYRKWYFQSKLVTCETMVVGVREEDVVTSIRRVNVDDLHILVQDNKKWNLGTSCDTTIKVFNFILGLYEEAGVQDNQTLVIQGNRESLKYYIRGDDVHNVLPEEFKNLFSEGNIAATTTDDSAY